MKAIETRYAGCRFRSRLEARWAVFFDTLGVQWEYEPEGLLVGPHQRPYLPDFRIASTNGISLWVEVKGSSDSIDTERLAATTEDHAARDKLLILGPIPRVDSGSTPTHWMIRRILGQIFLVEGFFTPGGNVMQFGYEYPFAPDAIGSIVEGRSSEDIRLNEHVRDAYVAARSARFEHGESGAPPVAHATPPQTTYSIAAEQRLLGGLFLGGEFSGPVELRLELFSQPAHVLILKAMATLHQQGEPVDAVTVCAELTQRSLLASCGGAEYLQEILHIGDIDRLDDDLVHLIELAARRTRTPKGRA